MLLVPFLQVIPEAERDEHLPEKLKSEWPAILRWAIDGCLAWQRDGLAPPESARAATKDYLDTEDLLGQWLEDRCIVSPKIGWTALKSLYEDWCTWAQERGLHAGTATGLGKRLDERGFERHKTKRGAGFFGMALVQARVPGDEGDENDEFSYMGRNDPLGARGRTREYADYGSDRHFRHHRHPRHSDHPDDTIDDRVRGEI